MELPDPRIGLEFGDYKVIRKIAQGGMGAVYLAEHAGMFKVVKFMLGEAMKIPAIRNRFITECHAAKRFKGHSGIVAIDSFGERNGELYLVMEYIDGVTLEDHIRRNVRLTEHHTFHIMVLCLRALSLLHAEGIIHRDLKPSNIFLRDTDERPWDPTLIDFGIVHDSKAAPSGEFGTREGQMIGTPGFMATEQFGGAHKVTPATDIFACAVMMWLMLTGELPWGVAENEYAQYDRQLHQRPVWPAQIPLPYAEGWKELLIDALSPDPSRRPATAQLFALMLAQCLAPIPPHVPSGLDMVGKLAPKFLQNLPPELETVRQPNGRIEVAAFWSPSAGGSPAARVTPSGIDLAAIRVSAVMQAQPVASAPTVSARPYAGAPAGAPAGSPAAAPLTTLSAASGVASVASVGPSPKTSTSRLRLAALGLGAAVAIGGVTFGVTRFGSRSSPSAAMQPVGGPNGAVPATPGEPPQPPSAAPTNSSTEIAGSAAHVAAPPTPAPASVNAEPPTAAKAEPASAHATTTTADATAQPAQPAQLGPRTAHRPQPSSAATKTPKTAVRSTDTAAKPATVPSAGASHASTLTAPPSPTGAHSGSATFDPDAIKE